ncbi:MULTISPECIES: fumarylacetoacetate hydrolase family protein [unclassified Actinopolyspora]|uniref:fumarylacetoacetate hydrolase family protein n=1 Tax=Actinopolyspora TaxID=1849 RepID=UPI0013F64372|nr:fumarylacetoacetate hydrolase family protein [Actinopolyspora sp. BKK2]NHE74660.1 fumarylacetoacetate hydrolase family protein [Actinopolyspora sp. BKK1]
MAEASSPFALGTFATGNEEFPGLVVDDRTLNLSDVPGLPGEVSSIVENWDAVLPRLEELAAGSGRADWLLVRDLEVRAPLRPRQIVQAGANYRTHVVDLAVKHAELGPERTEERVRAETAEMMDRRAAEGTPYLFLGLPGAVAGPYDDVVLPGYSEQHDWELELAAVIGRRTFRVGRESAAQHVAGYTIVNDLTTRDLVFRRDMPEIGTDWLRAKNAPGFLPTGPWLVPSSFVDPGELRLRLELNDAVMQDESTADMIFDVAALVSAASQVAELLPGDLVLTGSPAGNGLHHGRLLRSGDVMTATITGLGAQRTRCVGEEV